MATNGECKQNCLLRIAPHNVHFARQLVSCAKIVTMTPVKPSTIFFLNLELDSSHAEFLSLQSQKTILPCSTNTIAQER